MTLVEESRARRKALEAVAQVAEALAHRHRFNRNPPTSAGEMFEEFAKELYDLRHR